MSRRKVNPASVQTATAPKARKKGCLSRLALPVAVLLGGCLLLGVIASIVQSTGERIGLLPMRMPSPTATVTYTSSVTPTATETALPIATPAATATPAPTNTPVPAATLAPTDTPMPTGTSAPAATPTLQPTATSTPSPTAMQKATATPEPLPLAQRSEQVVLPQGSEATVQPAAAPVTKVDANLRAGPGTQYTVVGATVTGQRLEDNLAMAGQSADGQWLALADGSWIAASLVSGAPQGLLLVDAPAAAIQQTVEQPESAAAPLETLPAASAPAGSNPWPEYTCEDNPSPPPNPACPIKGNITSEHIYHMPGQQKYCTTVIDESAGERWFCSPAEAEAAGWRAAKR